jgi:CelD/BcsL family acetyltransferase involved in cellulose biosynthesis
VLLVTRDATDVYRSFRRKEWCGAGAAARRRTISIVERHLAAARNAVATLAIPHVSVDYAEYARDVAGVARRLALAFDVEVAPADIRFHPELDHSDLRGRISGAVRKRIKRLPRGPVDRVAVRMPRWLMAALFPERRYTRGLPER